MWATAHDEIALIRKNVPGAALALGLSLVGFALPLTSSISHSDGIIDMTIWGVVALIVQIVAYYFARIPIPDISDRIAAGELGARDLARRGIDHRRPPQRGVDEHMKRSAQVALVLMGVTGTTAAGAYMMPPRPECKPAPAASTTLNPPQALNPAAPRPRPQSRAAAAPGAAGAGIPPGPRTRLPTVFVVIFGPLQTVDELELQAQRADRSFDRAHIDRAQQHQQQHINKLKLVHLAWRLRIDQHLNVRRPFQQLSAAVMLNAGLARRANFTRPP